MINILSISDIHGELEAFDNFVHQVDGVNFDVVLIAGDLGRRQDAKTIVEKLACFGRPIFYVMGNWDHFSYAVMLHDKSTHIHLNHQRIGEWTFLGYSGSAANGYNGHPTLGNSYTTYQSRLRYHKRKFGSYENYCKTLILDELKAYISSHHIDVEDLVLLTHDRLYALPFFPFLYVFGHRHHPKYTTHKGVHLVNTSAISMQSLFSRIPPDTPGNFCLIRLDYLSCQVEFHKVPSPFGRHWAQTLP